MTTTPTLETAWGTLHSHLRAQSFDNIKDIVGLGGVNLYAPALAQLAQKQQNGATKGQLMAAIEGELGRMMPEQRRHSIILIAEELLRRTPDLQSALADDLRRHGWGLADNRLIPLELFDPAELVALPEIPRADLVKAAQRFRDGDLGGAISAACGAVDSAVALVYSQQGLGDPSKASFQEGCNVALGAVANFDAPLRALGWDDATLKPFLQNFKGALNQGAYVMQVLRSKMGDVHGTKPILKPLVFDALKWADLFVRTLTVH